MMQGVSAGSRMLFRNAFKIAKSSEFTAKTIGTKAVVSVGYQSLVEQKVNFVTVVADSVLVPWVGEFVGNAFSLELAYNHNTNSLHWSSATILNKDLGAKEFAAYIIKSTIKAVLNQNIQADKILSQSKGEIAGFGYSIVLHKLTVEIDKMIQQ
jgi:hypothetical protein